MVDHYYKKIFISLPQSPKIVLQRILLSKTLCTKSFSSNAHHEEEEFEVMVLTISAGNVEKTVASGCHDLNDMMCNITITIPINITILHY